VLRGRIRGSTSSPFAGYRDATTTKFGFVETLAGRYVWGRVRISGGEGLGDFTVAVTGASQP